MRYSLQRSAVNGALDATPPDTESEVLSSIAGSPYQQGLICRASWHLETRKKKIGFVPRGEHANCTLHQIAEVAEVR